jgi:WhiB family transcriptional regulator, redox-sensing transcriptional regulator
MSFEYSDFDHAVRFDDRLLGSVDSAPHTNIGPAPFETPRRPQLSLVPAPIDVPSAIPAMPAMLTPEDDLWQEKALCAQTDP